MDHYSTLGIYKEADSEDIKRAYRKLASQHHPDKGGDKGKFQEIQAAYATLSDPEKRAQYDNPQPQFNGNSFNGGFPPGFEDIFSAFGGSPFGDMFGQRRAQPQRNRTLNIQTAITLENAFNGYDLVASLRLPSGKDQMIEVKIPAGIQDGTVLRLANMGDDQVANLPRGDLHLTVRVTPHTIFQRQGDDLIIELNVSCIDAMIGKTLEVTTIDNKTLEVKINPGTQNGHILSAAGYGMPKMADNRFKGRLLMPIKIIVPTQLTVHQKQLLKDNFS
jgi:DnaJ-class molecular chaperone